MVETIRKKLMGRYQLKRETIGCGQFEVNNTGRSYVVDLEKRTCSCLTWDMTGIPCLHAYICIVYSEQNPKGYVHHYYSVEMWRVAYEPLIYPMPSKDQWLTTKYEKPTAPEVRKQPGSPKKHGRRNEDDQQGANKLRKPGVHMTCSRCNQVGHNRRKCLCGNAGTPSFTSAAEFQTPSFPDEQVISQPPMLEPSQPTTESMQTEHAPSSSPSQAAWQTSQACQTNLLQANVAREKMLAK
ncbi:uncharacterized protein LOC121244794 [Juglans microcarpa x Juglans regia]|uniref:uncharacterized protein LOC121244794 n=1 Tax=Juglans microcarpa x Juglans regia TaxID=2249226 RepID=UPI001B7F59A3|nr:uncharacterized protein LOC121244794 [Juglans microcarpa x Juglans regia]